MTLHLNQQASKDINQRSRSSLINVVTLGELQRTTGQMEESVHRTTMSHVFLKPDLYERKDSD